MENYVLGFFQEQLSKVRKQVTLQLVAAQNDHRHRTQLVCFFPPNESDYYWVPKGTSKCELVEWERRD
jgi:hypothetical protein